jgi:dTDP-4-dehydrorhamnose 3,5-epimerase
MGAVTMLEGVFYEPKRVISDGRGSVLHHLRSDDPRFIGFGEVYCSIVPQGVVRAWKLHKEISQRMIVAAGAVRFVLYDPREKSSTKGQQQEEVLCRQKHGLFGIPPGIWYGFEGLGPGDSIIINCTDAAHDPNEVERLPLHNDTIPCRWPASFHGESIDPK